MTLPKKVFLLKLLLVWCRKRCDQHEETRQMKARNQLWIYHRHASDRPRPIVSTVSGLLVSGLLASPDSWFPSNNRTLDTVAKNVNLFCSILLRAHFWLIARRTSHKALPKPLKRRPTLHFGALSTLIKVGRSQRMHTGAQAKEKRPYLPVSWHLMSWPKHSRH